MGVSVVEKKPTDVIEASLVTNTIDLAFFKNRTRHEWLQTHIITMTGIHRSKYPYLKIKYESPFLVLLYKSSLTRCNFIRIEYKAPFLDRSIVKVVFTLKVY